ncbi:MAG: M81 family metallopeptidase [Pseudomonadota bacterium]
MSDTPVFAVVGLWHETNTFSSVKADYQAFVDDALLRGDEIFDEYRESSATVAGFIAAADTLGFELVPLVHARTGPIGTITHDAFERILDEMCGALTRHAWDGLLVANHGAAVSECFQAADREILKRIRGVVGDELPIGLALDLHANIDRDLIALSTVTTVYQTNPHTDAKCRGFECAHLLYRTVMGEIVPTQWLETPPVVINITKQTTTLEPMRSLIADAQLAVSEANIVSTSVVQGYPYADVEAMGMSFLAISDNDSSAAEAAARWMAGRAWDRRSDFEVDIMSIDAALDRVVQADAHPVVLMDVGDNILGGSSGDSTVIAARARERGIESILQTVYDPDAVQRCCLAGVGDFIVLTIGGKTDRWHGESLSVSGWVRTIATGEYEDPGPTHGGFRFFNDGVRVVFETEDGLTFLLTSRRSSNLTRVQMYSVGLAPERFRAVIAKGVVSPRPAYEPIAAAIVLVNTPGLTSADLASFTYQNRRRPLYPFERDAVYRAASTDTDG